MPPNHRGPQSVCAAQGRVLKVKWTFASSGLNVQFSAYYFLDFPAKNRHLLYDEMDMCLYMCLLGQGFRLFNKI